VKDCRSIGVAMLPRHEKGRAEARQRFIGGTNIQ
jgi:hypothetical protein